MPPSLPILIIISQWVSSCKLVQNPWRISQTVSKLRQEVARNQSSIACRRAEEVLGLSWSKVKESPSFHTSEDAPSRGTPASSSGQWMSWPTRGPSPGRRTTPTEDGAKCLPTLSCRIRRSVGSDPSQSLTKRKSPWHPPWNLPCPPLCLAQSWTSPPTTPLPPANTSQRTGQVTVDTVRWKIRQSPTPLTMLKVVESWISVTFVIISTDDVKWIIDNVTKIWSSYQ